MQWIAMSEKVPDYNSLERCHWNALKHSEHRLGKCWQSLNEWRQASGCNYLISNEFLFE